MMEKLLEIRKEMKERKPFFIRQDNPKRMKLNDKWRKPKGIHSKIRHRFKGRRKMPSPGYKSPKEVKSLHSSGLKMIIVFSQEDLNNIKKEIEGIIISRNVGMKNKLEILKKAKEMNIGVLNFNADEKIKKIQDFINSKKKEAKKEKKQEQKESEAIQEKKEKESKKEVNDEQKKESEKKEKDKVLTKRL